MTEWEKGLYKRICSICPDDYNQFYCVGVIDCIHHRGVRLLVKQEIKKAVWEFATMYHYVNVGDILESRGIE